MHTETFYIIVVLISLAQHEINILFIRENSNYKGKLEEHLKKMSHMKIAQTSGYLNNQTVHSPCVMF